MFSRNEAQIALALTYLRRLELQTHFVLTRLTRIKMTHFYYLQTQIVSKTYNLKEFEKCHVYKTDDLAHSLFLLR